MRAKTRTIAATLAAWLRDANRLEEIVAVVAGEQTERQKQRQRAEACHQQIDVSRLQVFALPVVRDHQRPRCERHELPRHQETKGVIREDHHVHSGEVSRIERKDPLGRVLVLAVAECEQARGRASQIDHNQEERRECIDAEMSTKPWQAEWQCYAGRRLPDQAHASYDSQRQCDDQTGSVDNATCTRRP